MSQDIDNSLTTAGWEGRREYFHRDSSNRPLPPGPWDTEPNKIQWLDPGTDLDCLIVRGPLGTLCGYVGVPPSHPLYQVDYSDERASNLSAHGGITYSDSCDESAPLETGICHVPLPGRPDSVWWFGFDCGHSFDLVPGMDRFYSFREGVYRDVAYVRAEVEQLARQLAELQ